MNNSIYLYFKLIERTYNGDFLTDKETSFIERTEYRAQANHQFKMNNSAI